MDLAVVASELLANAYRACVGADTEVTLQCAHHQGAIVLAVTNPVSEWVAPADRWDFEDPLRTGGRSLLIVSALVDDLRVEHDLNRRCTVVKRSLDQADHDEQAEIDRIAEIEPEPRL